MRYALRFISGKYQGGELGLPDAGELLIGRATELDLVLGEDMVSRKHAKLTAQGEMLTILDLGSTNGTFVNGEKVKRAELKLHDRILVGTSILKVVDAAEMTTPGPTAGSAEARTRMQELGKRANDASTMSGDLTEVPLPDLLQLFATNKKSGILSLSGEHRGRIYLKAGQLEYAVIHGDPPISPMKALARMVMWEGGTFTLDPYEATSFPETLKESTESVLIEALRQCDEIRRILPELPPLGAHLKWCVPMTPKLASLNEAELDTMQLALNFGTAKAVLDHSPGTDHGAYMHLHKLLREGYLEVE